MSPSLSLSTSTHWPLKNILDFLFIELLVVNNNGHLKIDKGIKADCPRRPFSDTDFNLGPVWLFGFPPVGDFNKNPGLGKDRDIFQPAVGFPRGPGKRMIDISGINKTFQISALLGSLMNRRQES